jgi:dephospho-CoA kinase
VNAAPILPTPNRRAPVVGILGGIASGKSQVAEQFARLGATVVNADQLGHEVLNDPEVISQLVDRWGSRVCRVDGTLDRGQIAALVFGADEASRGELGFLEAVTHPRIGTRIAREVERAVEAGSPLVVIDAAVMLKAGWDRHCDHLVFVDVPREIRSRRAQGRGWTEAEFMEREKSQTPVDEKRRRATAIVDNSRSLEETFEQVNNLWQAFTNLRLSDVTA